MFGSQLTGWSPNADFAVKIPYIGYIAGPGDIYPNSSLYTTAAELLSAPAGAVDGYSGNQTGIDPTLSYSTQTTNVFVTLTNEYMLLTDRWQNSGDYTSTLVWLPITWTGGNPTVPFVSQFAPQSGWAITQPAALMLGL